MMRASKNKQQLPHLEPQQAWETPTMPQDQGSNQERTEAQILPHHFSLPSLTFPALEEVLQT